MSYGFEIRNASGQVVVDSEKICMGTGTPVSYTTDANAQLDIPVNGPGSFLLPMPVGRGYNRSASNVAQFFNPRRHWVFSVSGGTWTPLTSTSIPVVPLEPFSGPGIPNYGLAVFDSNGRCTFHSGKDLLSITTIQKGVMAATISSQNVTIPSDTTHIQYSAGFRGAVQTGGTHAAGFSLRLSRTSSTNLFLDTAAAGAFGPNMDVGPLDTPWHIICAKIV